MRSEYKSRYLSRFAGEDVGPLHHHDSHEVCRLRVEDGLGGEGNAALGNAAHSIEEGCGPIEHHAVSVDAGFASGAAVGQVETSEIELVVDG